jgi:serine/threonine protein kinase
VGGYAAEPTAEGRTRIPARDFPVGTSRAQTPDVPAEGDIIANRFRLVRELGGGSMGTVWLAYHLTLEVACAVKFIVSEGTNDPNYRARFHIEARTIAQLQSPNVVRVLDHAIGDDLPPYIAMEFLEGEDLWARLQRVGRLDARATCAIVSQAARGLSRAHAAGIIHRDLKPENIFLAREGDAEVVKLLDFGIARWTALPGFEGEGLVGTPEYMSPEQACGAADADCRSDLWSLAVTTYQCLTGQLPFSGGSIPEILAHIALGPAPMPSDVAPYLSSNFDRWWSRATARTIGERFQSASELADALGAALGTTERRKESRRPQGDAGSFPPVEAIFERRETQSYRPPKLPVNGVKFLSAAGLLSALIAILVVTGHTRASIARANSARSTPAIESPPIALAAPSRVEVETLAPTADWTTVAVSDLPQHTVKREPPKFRATRPPRVVVSAPMARSTREAVPKTETFRKIEPAPWTEPTAPKTDAVPKKEEAVVDFGI